MIEFVLLLLVILWFLGYLAIPLTNFELFRMGQMIVTLNDILIFLIIIWLLDLLPRPFREIAFVLFLLWILGVVGIVSLVGFSNIILVAIIVGLLAYVARERKYW